MIRILLLMLLALPMAAQTFYLVATRPGLMVGLARTPVSRPEIWATISVGMFPSAEAAQPAQQALEGLCRNTWEVELASDPSLTGGYADMWAVRRVADGWTPPTRRTFGGWLISSGLAPIPRHPIPSLSEEYHNAFIEAVRTNAGWMPTVGASGGTNAWIYGGRIYEAYEIQQAAAKEADEKATHEKKIQDAADKRALRLALKGAKSVEEAQRIYDDYLTPRGLRLDLRRMRLSNIDAPDEED